MLTVASESNISPRANIAGIVTSNGEEIPYVNIIVKGTTIGTTTNNKGEFKLNNIPAGAQTIIARGIGYRTREVQLSLAENELAELLLYIDEDALNIESVVVTADRNQMNRAEAPMIISSLNGRLFEKTQSISVADGLEFTPGLRMENNCQNCGFNQLRMNGLEGPYSQVLINSRPVFSGLAGVYGLELIPASMVDRVEIVRGGGSALYGGNAIAGTVNIITKEPSVNGFEFGSSLGSIGSGNRKNLTLSLDRILNLNASVVDPDMKSGLFIYGMTRDRDPFDLNNDGFSELVLIDNTTLGFNAFLKTSDRSKLSLDYYRINEFRRGGNLFEYLPHESDITEQVDHLINGASLSYDLFTHVNSYNKLTLYASMQTVGRDSYYGAEQDLSAYGRTNDISTSTGAQYALNFKRLLFAPASLVMGIDNNYNSLTDIKLGAEGEQNQTITNQYVNTLGSFFQNDWKIGAAKLSIGLRYDHYQINDHGERTGSDNKGLSGNVLAPRANLLYQITPSTGIRASYAKGYRAPQIFDEDLHIEASGARRILHRNSPDLKQETSHSITSSVNSNFKIGNMASEILAEGFFTQLIDPFSNEYNAIDDEGTYEYLRINAKEGARVMGVNIEWNTVFSRNFNSQIGYTYQRSQFETPQAWGEDEESVISEFVRTPNHYGYAALEYTGIRRTTFSATATYTGKMLIPHFGLDPDTNDPDELAAINRGDVITGERLEESERFLHIGARAAYIVPLPGQTKMELSLGVQNLFNQNQKQLDRGVYRDAGYLYGPSSPRMIIFGVKIGNLFR